MRKISEEKLALERVRLEGMREFENKYSDLAYVAGIDEAGRGPLAGPVVAAAVILPKDIFLPFLNDSKKVTEKRRMKERKRWNAWRFTDAVAWRLHTRR